jgi:hypothetical protein
MIFLTPAANAMIPNSNGMCAHPNAISARLAAGADPRSRAAPLGQFVVAAEVDPVHEVDDGEREDRRCDHPGPDSRPRSARHRSR